MRITGQVLVLDAADIAVESAFWAGLLGGTVATRQDWHSVIVDGAVAVGVQLAPDHQAPTWPSGGAQQVHLDLYVEDIAGAHAHATTAGARLLQVGDGSDERGGFHVYADPAGHPFCLCWGPPPLGELAATHLGLSFPEQEAAAKDAVRLQVLDPAEDRAQVVVRAHMADIASRYHQRPATSAEVDAALSAEPADDLALPRGLLVVATDPDGVILGCVGLRLLPEALGEITKVYVAPAARGRGLGRRLVEEIERPAALRRGRPLQRRPLRRSLVHQGPRRARRPLHPLHGAAMSDLARVDVSRLLVAPAGRGWRRHRRAGLRPGRRRLLRGDRGPDHLEERGRHLRAHGPGAHAFALTAPWNDPDAAVPHVAGVADGRLCPACDLRR